VDLKNALALLVLLFFVLLQPDQAGILAARFAADDPAAGVTDW
jgi:hypothetical protein